MEGGRGGGGGVKVDRWGYQVRTSSDACISAINSYYHQLLTYGRERGVILEAVSHDPDCVLANILVAHCFSTSDPSRLSYHLAAAESRLVQATPYEKAVFDAISSLIAEDRDDDAAFHSHSSLLKQFPKDLVSLKRAQILCFYMGRPDLSLVIAEQVLPQNQQESYIYGMLAFPLLELSRMEDAEKAARKGLEINKQDLWSQHNFCHVLQYECRFKEAVEFMEEYSSSWTSCSSFMYTHNWWHVAICYMEGYSPITKILRIYDENIWKELQRSDAVCQEVYLNALGLLLRIYLRGQMGFFGDRLEILTGRLMDQSNWNVEWLLDMLILWAFGSVKESNKAEDLLNGMKSRICSMSKKKQLLMQRVIKLAEALYAYGRDDYEQAFQLLSPDFDANEFKIVGASDEQLEVFNEVWYSVLLNSGRVDKAIEEIEKVVKKREGIPFLWRLLERSYTMANREEDAAVASEKAKALEAAYFEHLE
ncbi:tetratricopeptide repeat protein 38 [Macadamia integrifolia]|uniref:tetratricopeptide repeat protein 38 n=1 Tax=Macadamia integrifolia TaxID=60698 RepID=UPI001C4E7FC0|nr:tetratricopeptide repeat protein 38 [Macadamia integrifolia]